MATWSQKRKVLYGILVAVILIGAIALPLFLVLYKAPTCSDGKKNGNEQDVDCGGSCERLCQSAFKSPIVAWTRFEELAPSLYNVAAYLINPNTEGEAVDVPYHIVLYDNRGILITDTNGKVTLPPHRNTLAFQGAVNVGQRVPTKALFEFTSAPDWHKKKDKLSVISVGEKRYAEESNTSSLIVELKNQSVNTLNNVSVSVVLYDKNSNALGFSKTIVDEIQGQGNAVAPFTWPVSRDNKVISIEVLPVLE